MHHGSVQAGMPTGIWKRNKIENGSALTLLMGSWKRCTFPTRRRTVQRYLCMVAATGVQLVFAEWALIICCNTGALGLVLNSFMASCERWPFQVRSYNVRSNLWLVTETAHMSCLIDECRLSVASHGVWQQKKRDPQFDRTRLVHCRINLLAVLILLARVLELAY